MSSLSSDQMPLHFVGIGGIGMSGIAEVFLNQGHPVSGSDVSESDTTRRLRSLGARIAIGHAADNIRGARVVVVSSAIRPSNPEVQEARRLRIPVIPRAEMLGELMRGKTGIALAGTHGKTTTTSMLATVLTVAGLDPTIVIGGKVDSLGGNAKLGQGRFVVAEADESDGSFLHLPATYAVITNIDNDHLDHFGSLASIEDAFVNLVAKLPYYGMAVVCAEDPGVVRCLSRLTKPVQTYGWSKECDYYAQDVAFEGVGSRFQVFGRSSLELPHEKLGELRLNVPGRHNVLNALAVTAIATALDVPFKKIAQGFEAFSGVKRRFEVRWREARTSRAIVDDYGHHPTEIKATLEAARTFWKGKITVVFQPHRYSRTLHCHDGFLNAFHAADRVLLTDIYAAGEDPVQGVTSEALAKDIAQVLEHRQVQYVGELAQAKEVVLSHFEPGELVLCFGAGSITRLPEMLIQGLS